MKVQFKPLTADTWSDAKALFGTNGVCGGCWCMWWRKSHTAYERDKRSVNKRDLKLLAEGSVSPGLLFYSDNSPVGWCSLGPREHFDRLASSRILAPVDEQPVWSIVCLHVRADIRHQGVSTRMVAIARDYAIKNDAKIVEAYPIDPNKPDMAAVFAQTGFKSAFDKNDFVEVLRRSKGRPIMRYIVE